MMRRYEMQGKTLCAILCSLSVLTAQSVVWSYYAPTGGTYAHFRATRTIADVDGDMHEDVIAVAENDTLYCFSGLSGTPIWRFAADPCYIERGLISVPDLDGDTIADVVLGTVWGTRSVFAISGIDGTVIWQYDTHEYGQGGWIYEVAVMEDVTGDSVPEVLATAGGPDAERAYLFNGATGAKVWEDSVGYACFGVRPMGDINGDGVTDVAVSTGNSGSAANLVRFLDGSNGSLIRQFALPASGLTVVPIGDINGDTIPDVACGTSNGTILALSGADSSALWTVSVGGMVWDLNLLPDVDSSGHPELLPSGVAMYSFSCLDAVDGSTLWSTPAIDQVFVSVSVPDINQDGIPDVVGGTGYTSNALYAMDGSSGAILWQYAPGSPVESAYWIEDINGNGIPDILAGLRNGWFYAVSDGYVSVLENGVATKEDLLIASRFGRLEIAHSMPYGKQLRVQVYSILGRGVMDLTLSCDRNPIIIDVGALPSGVYFARVRNDDLSRILKFVVFE
jgi:outer membrane protein assembly factor BamB